MKEAQQHIDHSDQIDLIALLKQFWSQRRLILKITLVFTCIGLFVAIFSKNEYTASTTFVPVTQGKSVSGSLGGLASLAGINLGITGSSAEISPELYPQIVNSIPFQKELLHTQLTIEGIDTLVTYQAYYKDIYNPGLLAHLKKYTIGLPGVLLGALRSDKAVVSVKDAINPEIISITQEEHALIKQLTDQINLAVNSKEGFVSIEVTLPEAKASAQLTKKAQALLQAYVLQFKTQKSNEELHFIARRFAEKEQEFNSAKLKLATFEDQNRGINTALGRSKLIDLQGDYDLVFSVYSELAKQLEAQRLQVKKDTPIFTVLKPVTTPNEKSAPKRALIVVVYVFLGFVLSLGFVLGKKFWKNFRKEWAVK